MPVVEEGEEVVGVVEVVVVVVEAKVEEGAKVEEEANVTRWRRRPGCQGGLVMIRWSGKCLVSSSAMPLCVSRNRNSSE